MTVEERETDLVDFESHVDIEVKYALEDATVIIEKEKMTPIWRAYEARLEEEMRRIYEDRSRVAAITSPWF